ncbi:hypothetical protein [Desulforamulus hydrothermalis]|uniref:Uncharacterized protein n=1 Tax=Desulforamulus hydrothermalis Lam5 = DSM 18033 TaxID=1121428 RepID=K8DZD4_9FIRM|nr:hypothetical protein [Desulforamulus hydrothermalis]CCO08325.1 conserved hypothetical protein [Desulforamulus hydrothermalis Lam5 = DSM 18033]SHH45214.1 hypothetical protein SAMN02745177_02595 [Desulforamulus hydrothermalis Lam5 = DSM 18033]
MPSSQKRRGLFPAGYNAGGDFNEEVSTELGLTEQTKASKVKNKKKK